MSAPGTKLRAITPADNTPLPLGVCKALIIGGSGNLSVVAEDDTAAVTVPVQAGQIVPVRTMFVQAATTATGIVAIY